MTSMKPEKMDVTKTVKKIHHKEKTGDDSFPVTVDSKFSITKKQDISYESESDVDETFLNDDTFEDSCDHHITYLKELAKVAQISYDTYREDREDFKDCIDRYRKLMIEKSALTDALDDIKSDMNTLSKKVTTSKKLKKSAGKKMRNSKSTMTSYFMKVSDHKKQHAKTLLKTQKKLNK